MPSLEENLDEEGCIYMLLTYFPTEYSRELKKKRAIILWRNMTP